MLVEAIQFLDNSYEARKQYQSVITKSFAISWPSIYVRHIVENAQIMQPATYIMASKRNGTLYLGIISDLSRRIYEHKNNMYKRFSAKYGCKNLVYYELYDSIIDAIAREKAIKRGSRSKKL